MPHLFLHLWITANHYPDWLEIAIFVHSYVIQHCYINTKSSWSASQNLATLYIYIYIFISSHLYALGWMMLKATNPSWDTTLFQLLRQVSSTNDNHLRPKLLTSFSSPCKHPIYSTTISPDFATTKTLFLSYFHCMQPMCHPTSKMRHFPRVYHELNWESKKLIVLTFSV